MDAETTEQIMTAYRKGLDGALARGRLEGLIDAARFAEGASSNADSLGLPHEGRFGRIIALHLYEKAQTENASIADGSEAIGKLLREAIARVRAGT